MGECPRWYRLLVAAKYLGVAPWALERQPLRYMAMAEAAMDAEYVAERNRKKST